MKATSIGRSPARHDCRTPDDALAVMRTMATRWLDQDIAASLNRMGMPRGQGKTWTAHRVSSVRRVNGIHAYRSAEKTGEWLTMSGAASKLGVTNHKMRRLIKDRILAAEQVVPGAPHQIRAGDLGDKRVTAALGRKRRPYRQDLLEPGPQRCDEGFVLFLSHYPALAGVLAADLSFDFIKFGDSLQRLGSNRR